MTKDNSTVGIIKRTYMFGALLLLVFYGAIFYHFTLFTEDLNSERRLSLVGDYYFQQYKVTSDPVIVIDPVLTIYTDYQHIPVNLRAHIAPDWIGANSFELEEYQEFNVLVQAVDVDGVIKKLYAIENVGLIELDELEFILFEVSVIGGGLMLFLFAATYIKRSAKQISEPLDSLSQKLSTNEKDFSELTVKGHLSDEVSDLVKAINTYRTKIQEAITREQSFTRYISHELRTPMTVIKGSVSVLRKSENTKTEKHANLIDNSVSEMEGLTQTFLQLAREEVDVDIVEVDDSFIEKITGNFTQLLETNDVTLNSQVLNTFSLKAHPILLSAVISNLLKNAINCSLGGNVSLFISEKGIDIIDDGVGLSAKPRGYEGFGIGLKIVQDICDKYHWPFDIKDNPSKGCAVAVSFV